MQIQPPYAKTARHAVFDEQYLCLIQVRLDLSKLVGSIWILQETGTKVKSIMIASGLIGALLFQTLPFVPS